MTADPPEPAGEGRPPDDPAADHERRRLRSAWSLLATGGLLGVLAAAAVGLAGGSGQVGFVVLVLVWSLAAAATGLVVLVVAFVDDVRRLPVTRRRVVAAISLLAIGFVLAIMAFGAAAEARG